MIKEHLFDIVYTAIEALATLKTSDERAETEGKDFCTSRDRDILDKNNLDDAYNAGFDDGEIICARNLMYWILLELEGHNNE